MSKSRCVNINDLHYNFNATSCPNDMVLRSRSLIESYLFVTRKSSETGKEYIKRIDDIAFLLEAEKKKKLSPETLSSIAESMNNAGMSSAYDNIKSKLTDKQLLTLVKSRHLQAPCELVAWSSWLNVQARDVVQQFANALDSMIPKSPEPEKIQKVEVVNTPKSE